MWLRRMRPRRGPSMVARASWPAKSSPGHLGPVGGQPGQGADGVVDVGPAGVGDDRPGVADLAAALGVEGGAVQEDLGHARLGPARTATTRAGTA